jgi:16S rRNA (guanine966-N2)-methyltransferase
MSRIISGRYGGLFLKAAKHQIRPTTAKVKSYIFNVLQDVESKIVLDLFAGGGALGIEALSRGATHVTFVDLDQRSLQLIRRNLEYIKAPEASWTVLRSNALRFIKRTEQQFDLILSDPPYGIPLPESFFSDCRQHLNPGAVLVLEHGDHRDSDNRTWPAERVKKMGDTTISMYVKRS